MNITMTPVDSKLLAAIGHDPETKTLAVQFQDGRTYHYTGVEPKVYEQFRAAPSVGRYFGLWIRNDFPYTVIPKKEEA